MFIDVKFGDIMAGRRISAMHCALAVAIHRQTGHMAAVSTDDVRLFDGSVSRFDLPDAGIEFVNAFDGKWLNGRYSDIVRPRTFHLKETVKL